MLARVKAMIKHLDRSISLEFEYFKEESMGYHPDEGEWWYSRVGLWIRGESSLHTIEEYEYYYENS